ncbi:MAG: glycoside hydrolase family 3 protein [Deltaproteobacteria bacterium]|nr:glycoside hydrolase family 3 protein [Deltaproteobacteria bacterium]
MTREIADLAGQRLMVGFDSAELTPDLSFLITGLRVGGLILFARNVETPEQVRALIADCQDCAARAGLPPLIVAVDQEGGPVARLRRPLFPEFPAPGQMRDPAEAEAGARRMGRLLRGLGFNMNMAPVVDVAPVEIDSIMAARSFGGDPVRVGRMGAAVVAGLQAEGIMAVAKHFPGIGRTTLDSHRVQPVMDAPAESIEDFDLPPFAAVFTQGAVGVMLSHIRYPSLDPHWPASLSVAVARDLLRRRMGFGGLVLTDDLDMGAVKPAIAIDRAVGRILAADIDIALICHRSGDIEAAHESLMAALAGDGRLKKRAEMHADRIGRFKRRYACPQ